MDDPIVGPNIHALLDAWDRTPAVESAPNFTPAQRLALLNAAIMGIEHMALPPQSALGMLRAVYADLAAELGRQAPRTPRTSPP